METSSAYKELAFILENEIRKQYSDDASFIDVQIVSFRRGSVVAKFKLLFKQMVSHDTALAPLVKAVKDGNLGPLTVEPKSMKVVKESEGQSEAAKEDKKGLPYPLIIGVSCGGIVIFVLLGIYLVCFFKKQKRFKLGRTSKGLRSEVALHEQETYELREARSKEDIANYEEIGIVKGTGHYEKLHFSNKGILYQEVPADDGDYQEIKRPDDPDNYENMNAGEGDAKYYEEISIYKNTLETD